LLLVNGKYCFTITIFFLQKALLNGNNCNVYAKYYFWLFGLGVAPTIPDSPSAGTSLAPTVMRRSRNIATSRLGSCLDWI
jgi:hypothetical protein